MKMYSVIGLACALLLAAGCDFLRSVAGRPTTEELRALREQSAAPAAPEAVVAEEEEDPLPDLLSSSVSESGYLVIVGAYREPRHAARSAERYRRDGYEVCMVERGAVTLVGLCPSSDREEARRALLRLRAKGACPEGSWILNDR